MVKKKAKEGRPDFKPGIFDDYSLNKLRRHQFNDVQNSFIDQKETNQKQTQFIEDIKCTPK